MKSILGIALFLLAFAPLDSSQANLQGRIELNCEREPLTPNHYSAKISGPTRRGIYTLVLTEKFYGAEFPKTYKLKLESAEVLSLGSTKIKYLSGELPNMMVEISTDQAANLTFRCQ
jgi:hypothetical protein